MSDLNKSRVLRGILFVLAMMLLLAATKAVDYIHDRVLGGYVSTPSHFVEGVVYIWVCSGAIWRWLSRRVWIGSEPA